MTTYLGLGKNGALATMRLMPRADASAFCLERDFVGHFNSLASANNAQELLLAIDRLPAILPYADSRKLSSDRLFRPSEFLNSLHDGFDAFDGETLRYQSHFDAGAQGEDEKHSRATNWVVRNRTASTSGEFAEQLSSADDNQDIVVVEPLADWVLARNVLGLTARLAYSLQDPGNDDILDDAKLELATVRRLGGEIYRIPFAFNPYFYRWKINPETLGSKWDYERYMPLLLMLTGSPRKTRLGPSTTYHYDFGNGEDVFLATAAIARGDVSKPTDEPDRRFWLCAESNNRSQRELAEHIVVSMAEAVRALSYDGQQFGWVMDESSYYDGSESPRFEPRSLFAQLMYGLIFRHGTTLGKCEECGNAILDAVGGRPRSYCSEACRLKYIRRHR